VLHCTGVLAETAALVATCPALSEAAGRRLDQAREAARRARRPASAIA
jgi:hypothetical protein